MAESPTVNDIQEMASDFAAIAELHKRARNHNRIANIAAKEAENRLREMAAKYGFEVVIEGEDG